MGILRRPVFRKKSGPSNFSPNLHAAIFSSRLSFANNSADFEIDNIAAVVSSPFWYNSWLCFDSSGSALERSFASFVRGAVSSSKIWHYANNLWY
jgi:hypothetical protein